MSVFIPLAISIGCYSWLGISNVIQGDRPHAMMWFAYALAQVALAWYEYGKLTNG